MLKSRTVEVQDAADLFATLSINGKKVTPEEMEWKFGGGVMSRLTKPVVSQEPLDSDDDEAGEENPLKILAEKEALGKSSRRNQERNVPASESFEDKHTHKVAFKGDSAEVKSRFMPFNSVKNESLKDTENVGLKRRVITKDHKKVELMPLPNEDHKRELKLVSIEESLKIQRNQEKILKDLQIKNAMEKLREGRLPGLSDLTEVPDAVIAKLASEMSYRDPGNNSGGEEDHTSEHGEEEDAANDEPDYENPINS